MIKNVIALIALFAFVVTPVLAQGTGTTTPRDKRIPRPVPAERIQVQMDKRASTTERKAELKAEAQVRKASSTERRIEMQQDIAKRKAEHTAKVLAATIERLDKIVTRLESRITKFGERGANVAEAQRYTAEAKMHLGKARASLEAFSSIDLSLDKARENFQAVKNAASEVKTHIRIAHTSLKNAVSSLKGERPDRDDDSATSTQEQ